MRAPGSNRARIVRTSRGRVALLAASRLGSRSGSLSHSRSDLYDVESPLVHRRVGGTGSGLRPVHNLCDVLTVGEALCELFRPRSEGELPERLDLDHLFYGHRDTVDGELQVVPECQVDNDRGLARDGFGSRWRGDPFDGDVVGKGRVFMQRERPSHSDDATDCGEDDHCALPPRCGFERNLV